MRSVLLVVLVTGCAPGLAAGDGEPFAVGTVARVAVWSCVREGPMAETWGCQEYATMTRLMARRLARI